MIVQINIGNGVNEERCTELLQVAGDDTKSFESDWDECRGVVYQSEMPSTDAIVEAMSIKGWVITPLSVDLEVFDE